DTRRAGLLLCVRSLCCDPTASNFEPVSSARAREPERGEASLTSSFRRIPPCIALTLFASGVPSIARPEAPPPVEVVHGFDGPPALPAGLVEGRDGAFYGTSGEGGAQAQGTVYRITANGELTILHSFTGGADGTNPQGALVWVGGDFYGTTSGSPPASHGTVFRISTSGALETIFTFSGTDGSGPYATLTLGSDGRLYATTRYDGSL